MFKKKQMSVVARRSGTKVIQYARVCDELFQPMKATHKAATKRLILLAKTLLMQSSPNWKTKKATRKHLSLSGSLFSWEHCSNDQKEALLGKSATNDEAESTLGLATGKLSLKKKLT